MKSFLKSQIKGQSLVFFVFITAILFGVLAFSVDMGYTYYMRRWSQNAADSAALAAARQICTYSDPTIEAVKAAIGYAGDDQFVYKGTIYYNTPKNRAFGVISQDLTGITFGPEGGLATGEVQTDVAIEHPTFAANFFGQTSIIERATATAACMGPGGAVGAGVIPVAWQCRNIEANGFCKLDYISADNICEVGTDYMYVFFDSNEIYWCEEWTDDPPEGAVMVTCDADGDVDGKADIEILNPLYNDHKWFWVNIGGGGCTGEEIPNIIENGLPIPMYIHEWYPKCPGVIDVSYHALLEFREGDDVIIPVFYPDCEATNPLVAPFNTPDVCNPCPQDTLCKKYDGTTDCDPTNLDTWFHLTDFELFHLSCVTDNANTDCQDPAINARAWLEANNVDDKGKTVFGLENSFEGCFVSGYDPGFVGTPGSGDPEGAWTISLTR